MMRKSDYAFWTFVTLAGMAGTTTVFNVSRTYSATSPNAEIYKQLDLFGDVIERVRSDYVEKPDDAMLIDSAINGIQSMVITGMTTRNMKFNGVERAEQPIAVLLIEWARLVLERVEIHSQTSARCGAVLRSRE